MSPAVRSVGPVGRVLAESPTARNISSRAPVVLEQLVVLEQGSCDKLRTQEVGSKDAILLVGHVPQRSVYCMDLRPLLTFTSWPNISPTSRHRTNDKNALINMILSMGTCIQFHDENLPILLLYATMKIKEIIHIIFSSHCVSDYLPGSQSECSYQWQSVCVL